MFTQEFSFQYPPKLIAQEPLPKRDASRMMVLNRQSQNITDARFTDFPNFFKPKDLLILNNTKVLPARLWAKKPTGGKVEVLLVKQVKSEERGVRGEEWECLIRSMKGIRDGEEIFFEGTEESRKAIPAILRSNEDKTKLLEFPPEVSVINLMKQQGAAPLPPYIKRKETKPEDLKRYQTIFAEKEGAIAAPTAALHFTPEIFEELRKKEVEIHTITLHVGLGTFEPIRTENVEDHPMQTEFYEVSTQVADAIDLAKQEGRPVTAVGTTTVRALESYFESLLSPSPQPSPVKGERVSLFSPSPLEGEGRGEGGIDVQSTNLFIHPGYQFKVIDRFLTNFHQPQSTPLLLTSAFAGKDFLFRAYAEAIEKRYRLFSYGDCMLIL
jgi:S-adenosylmethionine:tRNA ribosyltransferase-isomerase